ncbi:MAG TPA: hypothetical protein VKX40_04730 [Aequorivita sp.]|nr:hypothetical protein [Aequorivita sp.]
MKKLMTIFIALVTFTISAQDQKPHKRSLQEYTPEQRAELQTKRMTLQLDLTADQQKKVQQVYLENAKNRPAKSADTPELSKNKSYSDMNSRLDMQIATKRKLKEILSEEQYVKWETHYQNNKKRYGNKRGHSNKSLKENIKE